MSVEQIYASTNETINASGELLTADIAYIVAGSTDEATALSIALTGIANPYKGVNLTSIGIDGRIGADGRYRVIARYQNASTQQTQPGGIIPSPQQSFDTTGGSEHITQAVKTRNSYSLAGALGAPDHKGAINVDKDGNVLGVDRVTPAYFFYEKHFMRNSKVTTAFRGRIALNTGKVNSDTFRTLRPGECLFMGGTGFQQGTSLEDFWEITFNFSALPNRTNVKVGDITVATKRGWDFLWVAYGEKPDTSTPPKIIKFPEYAYVEQIYEDVAFSSLGIPGI